MSNTLAYINKCLKLNQFNNLNYLILTRNLRIKSFRNKNEGKKISDHINSVKNSSSSSGDGDGDGGASNSSSDDEKVKKLKKNVNKAALMYKNTLISTEKRSVGMRGSVAPATILSAVQTKKQEKPLESAVNLAKPTPLNKNEERVSINTKQPQIEDIQQRQKKNAIDQISKLLDAIQPEEVTKKELLEPLEKNEKITMNKQKLYVFFWLRF